MPNRDAIFPSEKVTFPTRFAADDDDHLTKENTIFVDAFLYDAAAEEAMVDEGILPTAFCNGNNFFQILLRFAGLNEFAKCGTNGLAQQITRKQIVLVLKNFRILLEGQSIK